MPKSLFLVLLAALIFSRPLAAQIPESSSPILNGYISLALDSNLALHQRNFDLQKAQIDLRRAGSLFFPQGTVSSQYTLADGGRSIGIPIGDLLNNVYSTLNQLTASNKFPQVANQSIQFLPNNFQDTKMEVSLPILNTDLQHNREVSVERINGSRADRDIYSRDLVRSVRQAYYQYLQAGKAVEIYQNSLQLAEENRRVSEKFVANQMATREIVLRARAQVSEVESSLIEARNNFRNAAAWFNFLLNRSFGYPITKDPSLMDSTLSPEGDEADPAPAGVLSPDHREEFARLTSYRRVLESNLKWDRAYLIPKLSAFYDVGFQGYGIHFSSSQFYQLAGVQLVWPLFKANDNKFKIRQAIIDIQSVHEQYQQLTDQKDNDKDNDYDITVCLLRGAHQTLDALNKVYVNSYNGASIALSELATIQFQSSPTSINHYDKDRYTTVTAFVRNGYNTTRVTDGILKQLDRMSFPRGASYMAAGEVESKQESFGGLGSIILITVFGILGILILEFKTFRGTLIVLSVVPLGIIGAVLILLITGNTLSFVAIIGIIALVGIEVKNSILLVDYTDQLRKGGMGLDEAIQEAGETRFVPIILTTLTAIGGLVPLIAESNPLYTPLALVIIGGLLSSTLLTRVVRPVLYKLLAPRIETGHQAHPEPDTPSPGWVVVL